MEAIKELVKLGLGITVAAPWIATPEIAQGSLVWMKLPGPALRRAWCIASRGATAVDRGADVLGLGADDGGESFAFSECGGGGRASLKIAMTCGISLPG